MLLALLWFCLGAPHDPQKLTTGPTEVAPHCGQESPLGWYGGGGICGCPG